GQSDTTGEDVFCPLPGNYCCATGSSSTTTYECKSTTISACAGLPIPCDDHADCPTGRVCCGVFDANLGYTQVSCRAAVQCPGLPGGVLSYVRFCDPLAAVDECAVLGRTCQASQGLPGYYICK